MLSLPGISVANIHQVLVMSHRESNLAPTQGDILISSHIYTYSFEPKWDWSANYPSAPEIYDYFSSFADKYGLREYIKLRSKIVGARWNEDSSEWIIEVLGPDGNIFQKRCDFFISAGGILNSWRWPDIPGLDSFQGHVLHTANWNESIDLTGKRVGLIGNG